MNYGIFEGSEIRVGFIGAGNIAFALCSGLLSKGIVKKENVWASAPSMTNLVKMQDIGCNITHSNEEVARKCDVLILCVKPFKVQESLEQLKCMDGDKFCDLVISTISGVSIQRLKELLPPGTAVIRTVPNTPILCHAGVMAFSLGPGVGERKAALLKYLFSGIALCEEVPEKLLDAVCGVSGSGPAYVYTVIQAMSDGAVKMGLPRNLATKMAAQTVLGASKMVLSTEKHPAVLSDEVCSPGGTTIHGLHALERAGVRSAFMDAVEAATTRSKELGNPIDK